MSQPQPIDRADTLGSRFGLLSLVVIFSLLLWHGLVGALVGLGDAEALYFCYARHLSMGYLDHPPMIGWLIALATFLGGDHAGVIRTIPAICHALTLAGGYLLARDCFGSPRAGFYAVVALALIPMMTVGGLAAAPDAAASAFWMWTVVVCFKALDPRNDDGVARAPEAKRTLVRAAFVGVLIGLTFLSKYTGILLVFCTLLVSWGRGRAQWLRWHHVVLGGVACLLVTTPVIWWNVKHDWASVLHRLVWTQGGSGLSFATVGTTVGGQILYLGVPMAIGLVWALLRLWRGREHSNLSFLLVFSAIPLIFTYLLCLLSPAAEPHWPAQGYLTLAVALGGFWADAESRPRRAKAWLMTAISWLVLVLTVLQVAVWTPALMGIVGSERYEPRYDLTNELHGWPLVAERLLERRRQGEPVVGSHYTICSQLAHSIDLASGRRAGRVLCISDEVDDFDLWGDGTTHGHSSVLYVEDDRFGTPVSEVLPGWSFTELETVRIVRWGREVRSFRLVRAREPERETQ